MHSLLLQLSSLVFVDNSSILLSKYNFLSFLPLWLEFSYFVPILLFLFFTSQDFTGIEKREMSRNYFEKSKDHYGNWNLEDALSMFYDDPESNFSQNDSLLPKANGFSPQ